MLNYRFVIRLLGMLLMVMSGAIFLVSIWEFAEIFQGNQDEREALYALLLTGSIGLVVGSGAYFLTRKCDDFLGQREALLLVGMSWLWGAALAALPFYLWVRLQGAPEGHPFVSWFACYFESMSGLTTTGSTVLQSAPNDIESLPHGMLLWRSVTHWLGGLGIVMLFVAVLPTLGVGGKRMFFAEATGPTQQGVRPRIRETARVLWTIYLGMTVVQTLLLKLFGMTWFEAINHTFATLATGGFSTSNASAGDVEFSTGANIVIIVFMVLAGVNFGLYYQILRGRWRNAIKDPELRLYLAFLIGGSVIISLFLMQGSFTGTAGNELKGVGDSIQHGVFQVVSIQTTTGFCSADFNQWHFIPKTILLCLMFVGGCAGSTGGGIKVIRILIVFKVMIAEVERIFRPNVVRTVKIGKSAIDPEMRLGTLVYVMGIFTLFWIGTFLIYAIESYLSPNGIDFATASTASVATLNNIGPGLNRVGAVENFGWFSSPSLAVMSVLMALGRLEVYAIFVLFVPRFWTSE